MNKDVLIISAINPTRAYSCIKYLYRALTDRMIDTEVWCAVPAKQKKDLLTWGRDVHSFYFNFWGRIPKIRMLYMLIDGCLKCLHYRNKTIICHDLFHYKSCMLIKRLFPKTIIVHYCTEIYNEKSAKFQQMQMKFYAGHSKFADMTIECNEERRKYRVSTYNLKMPTGVILNTLPKNEAEKYRTPNKYQNEIPCIVYSGGIFRVGGWDLILNALTKVRNTFHVRFYCYGNKNAIDDLYEKAGKLLPTDSYKIIEGLGREAVLRQISNADIGIMYYDPEWSINTRYAAPTKFFEYIGLGIPLICSANDSLANIISANEIGVVMRQNNADGMAEGLEILLQNKETLSRMSKNALSAFDRKLCYEKQATSTIDMIEDLIKKNI